MCGIVGAFRLRGEAPLTSERLDAMCDTVKHRGPDDAGVYLAPDRSAGLGHRRLSIIDLTSGHQPMASASGRSWITFNGEIYNYRELREPLRRGGVEFRTTSDTEVILAMYEAEGPAAFRRLNGIFAFGLYDAGSRELFVARDHLGVKPLYYMQSDGVLVFASEIKALLAFAGRTPDLDYAALRSFLTFRYNPAPETLFAGVRKLPAGHFLRASAGKAPAIEPYWECRPATNRGIAFPEAVEEYRRLVRAAVRRQLVADVPVGLFLSGGVDSGAIGKLMAEEYGGPVKSYTVGFRGRGDYNELADARASAEYIGSEHHELELAREDYLAGYVRSFRYLEEPIAESTVPALGAVAGLAARDLKVVLAGQGADELVAGYGRYLGAWLLEMPGIPAATRALGGVIAALPRAGGLKRAVQAAGARTELERLLSLVSILSPAERNALANADTRSRWRGAETVLLEGLYAWSAGLEPGLARLLFQDARTLLPDDLLLFNDKMTMSHSLEMRVPFLDLELVEFVESLPASFKLSRGRRKRLHKAALAGMLPEWLLQRKKRGFATPMDEWLQRSLGPKAREILTRPRAACRRYFDVEMISRMVAEHEARRRDRRLVLFALLSFELWHETYFGASDPSAPAAGLLLER